MLWLVKVGALFFLRRWLKRLPSLTPYLMILPELLSMFTVAELCPTTLLIDAFWNGKVLIGLCEM